METKQLMLGIDIEKDTMLMSYHVLSKAMYSEPVTVREKGNEQDGITLSAAWDRDRQCWIYGTAAMNFQENRVDSIFERYFADDTFQSEDMICSYEEIVTGLIRYCLQLLQSLQLRPQNTRVVFTLHEVTQVIYQKLKTVMTEVGFAPEDICVQGHQESFFYYMTGQDAKLRAHAVLLLDHRETELLLYRMRTDHRTRPRVVRTELLGTLPLKISDSSSIEDKQVMDEQLVHFLIEHTTGTQHSSLFLVGEIFEERWFRSSLQYMTRLGRVFQGSNLFSRGAVLAGGRYWEKSVEVPEDFFIGNDMLTTSIGLEVIYRNKESYFPILVAGTNWYDADATFEFLLQDEESLSLSLHALSGRNSRVHEMPLPGLTQRAHKTVRIRVRLYCTSKHSIQVTVAEIGFGEFFPSTQKVWEDTIDLS